MRIWDINPGYLNRQSLLGEHRELHGIVSIIVNNKKGYSKHPETLRWIDHGWALFQRHQLLRSEMILRGFRELSPVTASGGKNRWPPVYIDDPWEQILILKSKYKGKEQGRIPLPVNVQQLLSQHKYSILARDPDLYKTIGKEVSGKKPRQGLPGLSATLVDALRERPPAGNLKNTLQHMWGHISGFFTGSKKEVDSWSPQKLLSEIQKLVILSQEPYLLTSTALNELQIWISDASQSTDNAKS